MILHKYDGLTFELNGGALFLIKISSIFSFLCDLKKNQMKSERRRRVDLCKLGPSLSTNSRWPKVTHSTVQTTTCKNKHDGKGFCVSETNRSWCESLCVSTSEQKQKILLRCCLKLVTLSLFCTDMG